MEIVAIVCSVVLAVVALGYGIPKAQLRGELWTLMRSRGLSAPAVRATGVFELLAVVGLMAGLFWTPAGIVASVVLVLIYGWGVAFRFMYGDFTNTELRRDALITLARLALALITLCVFVILL